MQVWFSVHWIYCVHFLFRCGSRTEGQSHGARWEFLFPTRPVEIYWPPTISLWTSLRHIRTTPAWRPKEHQSLSRWTTSVNRWSTLQKRRSALWKVTYTTQPRFHACSAEPRTKSKRITWALWCHAITHSSIRRDMDSSRLQAMLSLQWSNFWWNTTTSHQTKPLGQRWRWLFHLSHHRVTSWCPHHPPNTLPVLSKTYQSRSSLEVLELFLLSEQAKLSSSQILTQIGKEKPFLTGSFSFLSFYIHRLYLKLWSMVWKSDIYCIFQILLYIMYVIITQYGGKRETFYTHNKNLYKPPKYRLWAFMKIIEINLFTNVLCHAYTYR